jgi:hypothetical protein
MPVTDRDTFRTALAGWAGLLGAAGGAVALLGAYWDDAWHTDRGRDRFAIPPHLTLYGGILLTAVVLACWGVLAWRRAGWGWHGIRMVLSQRPLLLAGVGGTAVLASAPIDNAWHERYGRDAVLWSPPHMLGIAASVALSTALLAGLRDSPGRAARLARALAAAGVLAALQLPVMEFDSDVPQFSPALYLPVATAGMVLGAMILRSAAPGRWPVTAAAAVATALRAGIVLLLAGLGMSTTLVPPLIVPAMVDDILARRGVADWARALAMALAVPVSWLPALVLQRDVATQVPARLVAQAVLGCLVAAAAVMLLAGRFPRRLLAPVALVLTLALQLQAAPRAVAHDPGQGRPVGHVTFDVERNGDTVRVEGRVDGACPGRSALIGRRAGHAIRAPATPVADCVYRGRLTLPANGRWFIYLDLRTGDGQRYESWLRLSGGVTSATDTRELYVPPQPESTAGRDVVGAILYLLAAALLAAAARLAGSAAHRATVLGPPVAPRSVNRPSA